MHIKNLNPQLYSSSQLIKTLLADEHTFPEPFVNSFEAGERSSLELIKDFLKNYNYYDFIELPQDLLKYLHDPLVRQAIDQTEKEYKRIYGMNNTLSLCIRKYIDSCEYSKIIFMNERRYRTENSIFTVYILHHTILDLPIIINVIQIEKVIPISNMIIENDSLNTYRSIETFEVYTRLLERCFMYKAKKILKYLIDKSGINDIQYDLLLLTSEEIKNKDINLYKDCGVELSAQLGRLELLKYFHEAGLPMTAKVAVLAAQNGHLECLKYFTEKYDLIRSNLNGVSVFSTLVTAEPSICIEILSKIDLKNFQNRFECLKYAVENGYTLSNSILRYLPYHDEFLQIFVYLFEKLENKGLREQNIEEIIAHLYHINAIV